MADTKLNPKGTYRLYNDDGTYIESKGDNQYFQQAFEQNLPISVTSKGEWYVTPYMEFDAKNGVTAHLPSWFKSSPEYTQWKTISSQIPSASLTAEVKDNLNNILSTLGNQSLFRHVSRAELAPYNITDEKLIEKYMTAVSQMVAEAEKKGDAQLTIYNSDEPMSIKDIANDYKKLSKEDLSRAMTGLYDYIDKGANSKDPKSQEGVLDSLIIARALNYVDDNYAKFGDEYKGLLEASTFQKINAGIKAFMGTMASGTYAGILARGAYGLGEVLSGRPFSMQIEEGVQRSFLTPDAGGSLENSDQLTELGTWAGIGGNMAVTVATSMETTILLNGKLPTVRKLLGAGTIPGALATDFVFNDIPIDLTFFITDWIRTGDVGKAWYNPEEEQNFIGIPIVGDFGPKAPGGLAMNLLGDLTVDAAGMITTMLFGTNAGTASQTPIDKITHGAYSRLREKAALKNMAFQNSITKIPVFGNAWKKFMNHMMGAENAEFIRLKREEAVKTGSLDPYIQAQNLLTLKNHYGAEAVAPLYMKLQSDLGIDKDIKKFIEQANKYGGVKTTRVETHDTEGAKVNTHFKEIPDRLPKQVKDTLLDYQRLAELKGERTNEGEDLISNPKRDEEIAVLEKKIADVKKSDPEILEFADRFVQLNKEVERMQSWLGISNDDMIDALNLDPRFQNYMVRQIVTPERFSNVGQQGGEAKILNAKRKDNYNRELQMDPVMALDLKVVAIGKSYAWNEQAKMVVAGQIAMGGLARGKKNIDLAQQVAEARAEFRKADAARTQVEYDAMISGFKDETGKIANTFSEITEILRKSEELSMSSVYSDMKVGSKVSKIVDDFESGRISFADGVKEKAGLTDTDAADVIRNTYKAQGEAHHTEKVQYDVPEKIITDLGSTLNGLEAKKVYSVDDTNGFFMSINYASSGVLQTCIDFSDNVADYFGGGGPNKAVNTWVKKLDTRTRAAIDNNLKKLGYDKLSYEAIFQLSKNQAAVEDINTAFIHNLQDVHETALEKVKQSDTYNAGVTSGGIPYKYTIEDGKITGIEEIKDSKGLTESVNGIGGGTYHTNESDIAGMSNEHVHAINRALMDFKNGDIPDLGSKVRIKREASKEFKKQPLGFCPGKYFFTFNEETGRLESEFSFSLTPAYWDKENLDKLKRAEKSAQEPYTYGEYKGMTWHPKNCNDIKYTVIHENGHSIICRLCLEEINAKYPKDVLRHMDAQTFWDLNRKLENDILQSALQRMGVSTSGQSTNTQRKTISVYAHHPKEVWRRNAETIAEAVSDYRFNGANASKFSIAIVEEIKSRCAPFTVAPVPMNNLVKNGLDASGFKFKDGTALFTKDGQYNFPSNVKTPEQKAKWLENARKQNPYNKGKFDTETYKKANIWDSFFQKEITSLDMKFKSEAPESLIKRSGDYLEKAATDNAKLMIDKLKEIGIDGFDTELATMLLARNSSDIHDALNSFIIRRMDGAAEKIAAKMDGGLAEENLNRAKITVWSDEELRESIVDMVSSLVPGVSRGALKESTQMLFDDQLNGYASYEKLPVEVKQLQERRDKLVAELLAENKSVMKQGKNMDKGLKYFNDGTTHVIHYKESGEDVYVLVKDPVVASVLRNPSYKQTGVNSEALIEAANMVSRLYRLGTTGINPVAFVTNILRDPFQAVVQGGWNPFAMNLDPRAFYHTLRGYGLDDATIKAVEEKLKTWSSSQTLTAELRKGGLENPNSVGYTSNTQKNMKKLNEKFTGNKIVEKAEAPLEAWESMFRNQIAQQSFLKNYARTNDVNKAMSSAMFDASNTTTNFSHSVGLFKRATATVPYLSSAINGTASFWRMFNVDPIGMITRITAGFMVPVMAITAWNLSDEERRKKYMSLEEWYRDSHLVLIDLEGNAIAFPVPDELNNYFGLAKNLMEYSHEANPYSINSILAQGAFGFLPVDVNGFWGADGQIDLERGFAQMGSGLMPQAVTAIYELVTERDLFTGQDISDMSTFQKFLNTGANIFGSGFKNWVNDIGILIGVPSNKLIGKSTADTLSRNLFGTGFDAATSRFMDIIGKPSVTGEDGKEKRAATGLYAKHEALQQKLKNLDNKMYTAPESEVKELEKQKQEAIDEFTKEVGTVINKYMQMYSITGGLEEWKKDKIIGLLNLGQSTSTAPSGNYTEESATQHSLEEYGLARQRYVDAGLPAGPSIQSLGVSPDGKYTNSIEVQAALNKFYGVTKQANYDLSNLVDDSQVKDIRNKFYSAISKIYDIAEENNVKPDYDLIEKIQARYLQSVDAVLAPIINRYGINILNNNDFIDQVRRLVNGMVPTNDWKKSEKNAKKYLSAKEFPLAAVDVKDWLKKRYTSGMVDRKLDSDPEVTKQLAAIKADIDAGRKGSAKGKIDSLKSGINKSSYYISATDFQTLTKYNNMVK